MTSRCRPYPLAISESDWIKKLKQFCVGRVPIFVHLLSVLSFEANISLGSLFHDGTIKTEIAQGSMGQAVGVL